MKEDIKLLKELEKIDTYSLDGRIHIADLYRSFFRLGDNWEYKKVMDIGYGGINISVPSFTTKAKGKSLWLISGIHGEEPAGPNAIAENIEYIDALGSQFPVVLLPLCNPFYVKNQRYLNRNYDDSGEHLSIGDSDHVLLKPSSSRPISERPSSKEAETFVRYVMETMRYYKPHITIDLHEDDKLSGGYIYSHGRLGADDPIAKRCINLISDHVALNHSGKTRFGEEITGGIIAGEHDGSIDDLLSSARVIINKNIEPGPYAKTAIVIESPALGVNLEKRKQMQAAIIKNLSDMISKEFAEISAAPIRSDKIGNLTTLPQTRSYNCSGAVMQSIISYTSKLKVPQDDLYTIGKSSEYDLGISRYINPCGSKSGSDGLSHYGIISIARQFGIHGFSKSKANLDEIRFFISERVPVVIDWQSPRSEPGEDGGHYSIIKGLEKNSRGDDLLIINDPGNPSHEVYPIEFRMEFNEFKERWFDSSGSKLYPQWMVAFFKKPLVIPFKGKYHLANI